MKIHFAYRSGYEPTLRHLKTFESDSILSWFQENWDAFLDNEYSDSKALLGRYVYSLSFGNEAVPFPEAPQTMEELGKLIEEHTYCNTLKIKPDCIQVLTDDDEIELAWFVFTETYKQQFPKRVAVWFHDEMPTSYKKEGENLKVETKKITPKGKGEGSVYFMTNPIYDSGNFDDLEGVYEIEGIRLPELLGYLRDNKIKDEEEAYGINELEYLQHLANEMLHADLETVLKMANQFPITELQGEDFKELSLNEIKALEMNNRPEKSSLQISEHFVEMGINQTHEFFNYWVFFDDLWVAENPVLAKSFAHFTASWGI